MKLIFTKTANLTKMNDEILNRIKRDYFLRNHYNNIKKNDDNIIVRGKKHSTTYNTRIAKIFRDENYYVVSIVDYFSGHSLIDRKYKITKYNKNGRYVEEIENFTKSFFNKLIFLK